jgi:hypothetical protein
MYYQLLKEKDIYVAQRMLLFLIDNETAIPDALRRYVDWHTTTGNEGGNSNPSDKER